MACGDDRVSDVPEARKKKKEKDLRFGKSNHQRHPGHISLLGTDLSANLTTRTLLPICLPLLLMMAC